VGDTVGIIARVTTRTGLEPLIFPVFNRIGSTTLDFLGAGAIDTIMLTGDVIIGKDFRTADNVSVGGGPGGVKFDRTGIYGYSGGATKTFGIVSANGYAEVYGTGMFRILDAAGGNLWGWLDWTNAYAAADALAMRSNNCKLVLDADGNTVQFHIGAGGNIVFSDSFGALVPTTTGNVDLGTNALKFGDIWGTVKYSDLHLLDTHCPRCGKRFKVDDSIKFTVTAAETLEDSEGTSYEQIRCIPIHVRCSLWSRIKNWRR